ncbi:hypothetical protein GCWU000282_01618 [Catonella morbi ATCC 51271]|uniref:Uncharacterized protein n=1 Tax=Catonella morbi ATCC 51271 TaxID=592026 RepID=V2Y1A6_9FIRM|nr:hypothetical protein GCWU000282_01618 [Catonella morbi ATCC 51271]
MSYNNYYNFYFSYYSVNFYKGIKFFPVIVAHIYVNSKLSISFLYLAGISKFIFSKISAIIAI